MHSSVTSGLAAKWQMVIPPQSGNRRLADLVTDHRDFFAPLACIDPTAPYWQEDLETSIDELGMSGIRIYPVYHHFDLDDERGVPVCPRRRESFSPNR